MKGHDTAQISNRGGRSKTETQLRLIVYGNLTKCNSGSSGTVDGNLCGNPKVDHFMGKKLCFLGRLCI